MSEELCSHADFFKVYGIDFDRAISNFKLRFPNPIAYASLFKMLKEFKDGSFKQGDAFNDLLETFTVSPDFSVRHYNDDFRYIVDVCALSSKLAAIYDYLSDDGNPPLWFVCISPTKIDLDLNVDNVYGFSDRDLDIMENPKRLIKCVPALSSVTDEVRDTFEVSVIQVEDIDMFVDISREILDWNNWYIRTDSFKDEPAPVCYSKLNATRAFNKYFIKKVKDDEE